MPSVLFDLSISGRAHTFQGLFLFLSPVTYKIAMSTIHGRKWNRLSLSLSLSLWHSTGVAEVRSISNESGLGRLVGFYSG